MRDCGAFYCDATGFNRDEVGLNRDAARHVATKKSLERCGTPHRYQGRRQPSELSVRD